MGFDFVQLYPSLEAEQTAEECFQAVLETPVKFAGVNYKEGIKYIAINDTDSEHNRSGLHRVLPRIAGTRGSSATITGAEALGPHSNGERKGLCLTDKERRWIVAMVVRIGVRTLFTTHMYSFGGKVGAP